MLRLDDSEYYEHRSIEHCQQGDVFRDVPMAYSTPLPSPEEAAGKRVRPSVGADAATATRIARWAVVCSYTCGFLAQPLGTRGYAHPYRLVAEIRPIRELVGEPGLSEGQARGLVRSGGAQGLMYVPLPEADDIDSEWRGVGAALLYAPCLVTQPLLDSRERVTRMTTDAQRILVARLWQTLGPYMPEPSDPRLSPDMTDGWAG